MNYETCQSNVQDALGGVEGVAEAIVDSLAAEKARIVFEKGVTNLPALCTAIEKADFEVN